jgi:hypothetical protein
MMLLNNGKIAKRWKLFSVNHSINTYILYRVVKTNLDCNKWFHRTYLDAPLNFEYSDLD